MREIIGFHDGDSVLAPGGSISNLYALLCARHKHFPGIKSKGTQEYDSKFAIYTSSQVKFTEFEYFSVLSKLIF